MMCAIMGKVERELRAVQIQREVGNMFFEGEMEARKEEEERKVSQRKKRLERRNSKYETEVVPRKPPGGGGHKRLSFSSFFLGTYVHTFP